MPETLTAPIGTTCYTVLALAKRWRCRPSLIRRWLRLGKLAGFQLPGARGLRISPEAVAAFEQGGAVAKTKPQRRRQECGGKIWY
jgi:hypothetical protein